MFKFKDEKPNEEILEYVIVKPKMYGYTYSSPSKCKCKANGGHSPVCQHNCL